MRYLALAVGICGFTLSVVGALWDIKEFYRAYLFTWLFWLDLPLGALPVLMAYALTGGAWGTVTRRIHSALSDTIWVLAILFVPILMGLEKIYPWRNPTDITDPKFAHKALYFSLGPFIARALFYFASWLILNFFLQRWLSGAEKDAPLKTQARLRTLSGGGLVAYAFTATFASIDWQMSIEPLWYSTIYGLIFCAGQTLGSFAFSLIVLIILLRRNSFEGRISNKTFYDLGNLLTANIMVWAYLSFFQLLVIWSGNLPDESTWYLHRTKGGWEVFATLLILFHFFAPFSLLLFRRVKSTSWAMIFVCAIVLIMRFLDRDWMVTAGIYPEKFHFHWQQLSTAFGIGGIWLFFFLRRLSLKREVAVYV